MKRLAIGILAHVDSGKTTLSEGLLFTAGEIRKLGRVDHKSAFLDTNEIERERGITIFSKQAVLSFGDTEFTLLDTPGHVDFSAEMERTLPVLDYAVLVVSGSDGVQSHTETLWKLLEHYNVPTFVFVNKMDLGVHSKEELLADIHARLSEGCLDFAERGDEFFDAAAMTDHDLLDEFLETDAVSAASLRSAIKERKIFPCCFGSALKMDGVAEFLQLLDDFTLGYDENDLGTFGARVFKISEDEKGQRLTHIKITGGSLKVKTTIEIEDKEQKINEIRVYSGVKYKSVPEVSIGAVCAIPGLTGTFPGQGFGKEPDAEGLVSEPVFTYSVKLPDGTDVISALAILRKLQEEETKMNVVFNERLQTINVQIMGEVQLEVLKRILEDRFDLAVTFEHGSIIYYETIANVVEGVGHYEPLRHYAEVHLLIEPGERGSGVVFSSTASEDLFSKNWQRLVMGHLSEKTHIGVLTGSPITDVKVTLVSGRAHEKHTEGGDFRQATYRAVRQGLMQAESVLLEPYYSFTLEVPLESTGRAMTDLQQMGAKFAAPETKTDISIITGRAPVAAIRDYHKSVIAYTHGRGRFNCVFDGYDICANPDEVIASFNYDAEADVENTPDSVFCANGGGFIVKWDDVFEHMHLPALNLTGEDIYDEASVHRSTYSGDASAYADEADLVRIFEKTYGKIEGNKLRKTFQKEMPAVTYKGKEKPAGTGPQYLLIDGYNIIFAWEELSKVAKDSLDLARTRLIDRIANYQAFVQNNVILVFDAYKVKEAVRKMEKHGGITVVYTKEAETADQYIEKTTKQLSRNYRVRVATSDYLEQVIILGHGAHRVSAPEFLKEVEAAEAEMEKYISR